MISEMECKDEANMCLGDKMNRLGELGLKMVVGGSKDECEW